jgi:hypothetical protein
VRRLLVALFATALVLLPLVGAEAKKGENNAGGSERSHQVRQNENHDAKQDGTGTPDAGDNRHPSGKDRSVEPGGSWPQGRSRSDPDGMENGGADKPGGSGGIDKADQDGNNGCGNDDDFEDDNNGLCLGRLKKMNEAQPQEGFGAIGAAPHEGSTIVGLRTREDRVAVFTVAAPVVLKTERVNEAIVIEQARSEAVVTEETSSDVLGAVEKTANDVGGTAAMPGSLSGLLPLTGLEIAFFALAGLSTLGAGLLLRRMARRRAAEFAGAAQMSAAMTEDTRELVNA